MPRDLRIDGIILAAGTSSRFGRPKQLLPLAGKPLLQHAVDNAASMLANIVVVTGANATETQATINLPPNAHFVHNPDFATGQASSLATGLLALPPEADAAAILVGDQPGITPELIERVIETFRASDAHAARTVYGRTPGHPVVLARELWPELLALTGDTGARAVLSKHPDRLLEISIEGEPPPDIDTEDAYEQLKQEYEDQ